MTLDHSEITKLRETIAAQAAVIEKLREALQDELNPCCCFAGCEFCNGKMTLEQALAIPTDSTQILAEVRRAERERCAKVCDEQANEWDSDAVITFKNYAGHCAAEIRAME